MPGLRVRYGAIKQRAEALREQFGCDSPPVDVGKVLSSVANVHFGPSTDGTDGWTMAKPDCRKFEVYINAHKPRDRRRWTMAHELGHIVMGHFDVPECGRTYDEWKEREANTFAEELLIPWVFVKGKGYRSLGDMHRRFQVSVEACAWRLRQLNDMCPGRPGAWLGIDESAAHRLLRICDVVVNYEGGARLAAAIESGLSSPADGSY